MVYEKPAVPTLGRIVHYRGKYGFNAMRMAFVACTRKELIAKSVEEGEAQPLDSNMHVHLQVVTIGSLMMFPENNVPYAAPNADGEIPPGTWTWPPRV